MRGGSGRMGKVKLVSLWICSIVLLLIVIAVIIVSPIYLNAIVLHCAIGSGGSTCPTYYDIMLRGNGKMTVISYSTMVGWYPDDITEYETYLKEPREWYLENTTHPKIKYIDDMSQLAVLEKGEKTLSPWEMTQLFGLMMAHRILGISDSVALTTMGGTIRFEYLGQNYLYTIRRFEEFLEPNIKKPMEIGKYMRWEDYIDYLISYTLRKASPIPIVFNEVIPK